MPVGSWGYEAGEGFNLTPTTQKESTLLIIKFLMDDQQFRKLLDFLGLSWKGYRKVRKGVKKRISRYMQAHGYLGSDVFLSALEKSRERREQVEKILTVSISRFFRDRKLWQALVKYVLPLITAEHREKVKVWSAGCACGEEVYSFKILWQEWGKGCPRLPELQIWATDLNPEFLSRAQTGIYSWSSVKEVSEEWLPRYFSYLSGTHLAISSSLKEGIHWSLHDLLSDDTPQKGLQIVFLRNNLLTYYQGASQKPALNKVIDSLSPGGFLIIGAHEKIPKEFTELLPFPHHPNVLQKNPLLPAPVHETVP